jgi:hypothetical protein
MLFSNLLNQLLLKANCRKINSIKKASTIVKALILVIEKDLISNQFIQDLEVLCGLKGTMNLWGK